MKKLTLTFAVILFSIFSFATVPPTGTITTVTPTGSIMPGQNFTVKFLTNFAPKEVGGQLPSTDLYRMYYFWVELSDVNGNFGSNPTVICANSMVGVINYSGGTEVMAPIKGQKPIESNPVLPGYYSISARMPLNTTPGGNYKIRVKTKYSYWYQNIPVILRVIFNLGGNDILTVSGSFTVVPSPQPNPMIQPIIQG